MPSSSFPFPILGVSGVHFHLLFILEINPCKQTMETLIRRRAPFYGMLCTRSTAEVFSLHLRIMQNSLQINVYFNSSITLCKQMSQLMRLWYLSHRRPAKAQASLRICAVSPEPSLFAHMKYGSRRKV